MPRRGMIVGMLTALEDRYLMLEREFAALGMHRFHTIGLSLVLDLENLGIDFF